MLALKHAIRQGITCARAQPGAPCTSLRPIHTYDIAVAGLGVYGSAAAYYLAHSGLRVLGLEQYGGPGHPHGSSHGHSRIIRLAYREGPQYLPLLKRSYRLFAELEQQSCKQLLVRTGILEVGPDMPAGMVESATAHDLPHEVLTGAQVRARFPGYSVPDDWQALYQPDAGMLAAEPITQAFCDGAAAAGADLRWCTRITSWKAAGSTRGSGVEVHTADGTRFKAKQVVVTAGPWMSDLLPELKVLLTPVRQVVAWFQTLKPHLFKPEAFPVFILTGPKGAPCQATHTQQQGAEGHNQAGQGHLQPTPPSMILDACWYGFPEWGPQPGLKIGLFNHLNEHVHPDSMDRSLTAKDEAVLRAAVAEYFPAANSRMLAHNACIFTNTPDNHFLIDRHPEFPQVLLCSACSGHGFKMSAGIGQLIAEAAASWDGSHAITTTAGEEIDELSLARIDSHRPKHQEFLVACKHHAGKHTAR